MRQDIIYTLAQNKDYEQLAEYLDAAFWHWEDECLTLTSQDPQARQFFKNNTSSLLRFFQNKLMPKYSVVKLSLQSTAAEPPQVRQEAAPQESSPKMETPQKPPEETPQETLEAPPEIEELQKREIPREQAKQEPPCEIQSPKDQSQGVQSQEIATPPKRELPQIQQAKDSNASPPMKKEEIPFKLVGDYSELPPEVQLLQKAFKAEVKVRTPAKGADKEDIENIYSGDPV